MGYLDLSPSNGRPDAPTPQISSVIRVPIDPRLPVKHILIGAPIAVQHTQHRLHQLGYTEVNDWAKPLELSETLTIVPDPGDVISLLIRYLRIK